MRKKREPDVSSFLAIRKVRLEFILGFALVLLVWAVFGQSILFDFVAWDDDLLIYKNPNLGGITWERLCWMFGSLDFACRYLPLTWLSWSINYELGGLDPLGYHAGNLLLHTANVLLVFVIIRKIIRWRFSELNGLQQRTAGLRPAAVGLAVPCEPNAQNVGRRAGDSAPYSRAATAQSANMPAAVAAAIWGVHPLRAEPVAWATDRVYCQALFFLLLAFWFYLAWRHRTAPVAADVSPRSDPAHGSTEFRLQAVFAVNPRASTTRQPRSTRGFYWLGVLLFAASMFSYQTGLCYAAVLVVLDFWPFRRFDKGLRGLFDRNAWRIWLEKVPYGLVAILVALVALTARFSDASKPAFEGKLTLLQHITQAFYVWAYYLWKPLVPINLSPFYNTLLTIDPAELRFVASIGAVILFTLLFWWRRRKWPGLLAAWTCHLALLLPVAGFTEYPHYTSDRYSYFVAICSCCVLGALLMRCDLAKRWRSISRPGAFCLVFILAIIAHEQTRIWKNSVTLLEHILAELKEGPAPPGVHWRLANAYAQAGQTNLALGAFRQFIATSPDRTGALAKTANALFTQTMVGDAQRLYAAAVVTRPDDAEIRNDYGVALAADGKSEEGLAQLDYAARLRPDLASPWQNMALVLMQQRRTNEAKPFLDRARALQAAKPPQ